MSKAKVNQKVDLDDYLALKEQEAKKKPVKLPLPVKIFLVTPFLLIFCFGVFYLPYMVYTVFTSPVAEEKEPTGTDKILKRN